MVRKAWMQEPEAADHIAAMVRKQREMEGWCSAHVSCFVHSGTSAYRTFPVGLSSSVQPTRKLLTDVPSAVPLRWLQIWSS